MKFDEGEAGSGDGAVVMVLVADDADAGGDFHFGIVGIGAVFKEEDLGGPRRQPPDFNEFLRFLGGYDPAVLSVVAAEAFWIAELHARLERPAKEEIVAGEELVERGGVFFEFRVIEIRGQRIKEDFVALCFDQKPGHGAYVAGGPIKITGEAGEDGDCELGLLDDFLNRHFDGDLRLGFFFRLLVGPSDGTPIEPPGAGRKGKEAIRQRVGIYLGR